ncbi:hypothetical protein HMPREF1546_00943 [Oscillibacter sp. KLE 1745]|nr:hypothetical protein HMPREF1546_00943 [Oscillibacter sp. KLE 1745]
MRGICAHSGRTLLPSRFPRIPASETGCLQKNGGQAAGLPSLNMRRCGI